jgi:hypothetical protein
MPKGITSLTGYIRKIEQLRKQAKGDLFFRGHPDIDFVLKPSVLRNKGWSENERSLVYSLIAESPKEFETDRFFFDKLVRAQHYGIPTRLLDVTTNPLMALYFVCEKCHDKRGQVVVFETPKQSAKYFLSDSISCKSNLAQLSSQEKDQLLVDMELTRRKVVGGSRRDAWMTKVRNSDKGTWARVIEEFNKTETVERLVQFIKEEKPYFLNRVDPVDLLRMEVAIPKKNNVRIAAQSGAFLTYGLYSDFNRLLKNSALDAVCGT